MNVRNAVTSRRSIRRFKDKEIKREILLDILNNARWAASAGNSQNWVFVVVTSQEKKKELVNSCLKQRWMLQAPVWVVVCNDKSSIKKMYGSRGEKLYSVQDCANISTTIMLLAHEQGISSCWIGAFDPKALARDLKAPAEPEVILVLGYSDEKLVELPHRHDLQQMTFWNDWGNKEPIEALSYPQSASEGSGLNRFFRKFRRK